MGWKRKGSLVGILGAKGIDPKGRIVEFISQRPCRSRHGRGWQQPHLEGFILFSFQQTTAREAQQPKILNTNTTKFFRKQQLLARARPRHSRGFFFFFIRVWMETQIEDLPGTLVPLKQELSNVKAKQPVHSLLLHESILGT